MHPSLTILDERVTGWINTGFEIHTLVDDCLFTEGPVWHPEGFYLFSDISANCIYKISESEGKQVYLRDAGCSDMEQPHIRKEQAGPNGLALLPGKQLLICQHGDHALAVFKDEQLRTLVREFNEKPLNSPNDLIIHSNGSIYFSDPPYGLKDSQLHPGTFQPHAGVYCLRDNRLQLICDSYQYPNGVCLSPDEKILYICSSKPFEARISMYDTSTHELMGVLAEENSDGIETDPLGNIYLCSREGIIILNARGERQAMIRLDAIPANCCWGPGGDLLVTARQYIYLVKGLLRH